MFKSHNSVKKTKSTDSLPKCPYHNEFCLEDFHSYFSKMRKQILRGSIKLLITYIPLLYLMLVFLNYFSILSEHSKIKAWNDIETLKRILDLCTYFSQELNHFNVWKYKVNSKFKIKAFILDSQRIQNTPNNQLATCLWRDLH